MQMMTRQTFAALFFLLASCNFCFADERPDDKQPVKAADASKGYDPAPRYWKGNLHTHSLWSDGNDFPEMIAHWYRDQGYNFLALSDHNTLSEGIRWMPVKTVLSRGGADVLDKYRQQFGPDWVETRGEPTAEDYAVRLKPLNEFRALVEDRNRFLMIQSEEISDRAEGKPVHMNAGNVKEPIEPAGGATVRETISNNLRSILEQEARTGREMLPHLNHPNFGLAITAEDMAAVVQEQFFEVYNGHPGVKHLGDHDHPGVEKMWDIANTIRLAELGAQPLLGIATDDTHHYHGRGGSRPGRGWVMVRAKYLTPEHIIRAIEAGDFYASSGVTLSDVRFQQPTQTLKIEIAAEPGVTYVTEFIGTMKDFQAIPPEEAATEEGPAADAKDDSNGDESEDSDENKEAPAEEAKTYSDEIGKVLKRVEGTSAEYTLSGDELYVRAVVTSSKHHQDPSFEHQHQQAWVSPVLPASSNENPASETPAEDAPQP